MSLFWKLSGSITYNVRIIKGQSNAVGYASNSLLASELLGPQAGEYIYLAGEFQLLQANVNNAGKDPQGYFTGYHAIEMRLMKLLRDYYNKDQYLFKYGRGGIPLANKGGNYSTWSNFATGNNFFPLSVAYYNEMKETVIGKKLKLVAEHWIQGEQDASNSTDANAYKENITSYIAAERASHDKPNLLFIIYSLSDLQTAITTTERNIVKASQMAVAEWLYDPYGDEFTQQSGPDVISNVVCIVQNEAVQDDNIHYTSDSQDNLAHYGFQVEKRFI